MRSGQEVLELKTRADVARLKRAEIANLELKMLTARAAL